MVLSPLLAITSISSCSQFHGVQAVPFLRKAVKTEGHFESEAEFISRMPNSDFKRLLLKCYRRRFEATIWTWFFVASASAEEQVAMERFGGCYEAHDREFIQSRDKAKERSTIH